MSWHVSAFVRTPRAHLVGKASPGDAWQALHRLADAAAPALERAILAVLASVGPSVSRAQLAQWLTTGNREAATEALRAAWAQQGDAGLRAQILPQLRDLAIQAAEETALVDVGIRFNVRDAEAIAALERYAGAQITAISETTRQAVQGIVVRAFESGTTITQQLSEIEAVIGLTPRQTERVARYRQGLVAEGASPAALERAVTRLATQVRRQRAEAIARTETMGAVHRGQQERWEQAVRDGVLDAHRLRRSWIVTPDDRLCTTICAPIPAQNADGRRLHEPFQTPVGAVQHPPAHPGCKCALSAQVR